MEKIAFFSPFSPIKSGVCHYSEELIKRLCEHYDLDLYIDEGYTPTKISEFGRVLKYHDFKNEAGLNFYQVSNNPAHRYMYAMLKKYSGVITLHDANLYDMVSQLYSNSNLSFLRELWHNQGIGGYIELLKYRIGKPEYYDFVGNLETSYIRHINRTTKFGMIKRVVDYSQGVVVHSQCLKDKIRKINKKVPIKIIPHGVNKVELKRDMVESREYLNLQKRGISDSSFIILSFGFIQHHKRVAQILMAFKEFLKDHPDSLYVLIGPKDIHLDVDGLIKKMNLEKNTLVIDNYIPMAMVNEYINASNLCFNLRWPTFGSFSGTLYKIFATGKACVVTNIDSFGELPDEIVIKIGKDDEIRSIKRTMENVHSDPDSANKIGRNAKEYIDKSCLWEVVSEDYREFFGGFIK